MNVERVKHIVLGDRRLTVRMIASQLDMKKDGVLKIITKDLGMWKGAKMVPSQDIIERLQNEPDLLRRVITSDETWIFE